ncbi:MAG: NAD(P)-dependent oxidoreductase [Spirochaetes bacterium]|nr:NAD(P)-dependent oxidoreductase [Spirochaetota bacterium]
MKKILLTGGNGFFGTRFTRHYNNLFQILSTDVSDLNILNKSDVNTAMRIFKPDIVIHAAAVALTDYCNKNPEKCREINVTGALNVAEACKKNRAKLIFLSSEQVYNGNTNRGPFTETDTPHPDTIYGENKLEAENLLKKTLEELWILRFTWMFGVPQKGLPVVNNILWDTVKSIMAGRTIHAPVNEYRGLTNIDKLIDRFYKIFELPFGTYHVGSANNISRYKIVKLIFKELGLEERTGELLIEDTEKYKDNPRDVRLNTEKLKKHGIIFKDSAVSLKECIRDYSLAVSG